MNQNTSSHKLIALPRNGSGVLTGDLENTEGQDD